MVTSPQIDAASPAVSVIMPAYAVSRFVAQAVESAFRQTFTDFELVVVNDGSPDTDDLERALAPYRTRIKYLQFPENRGISAARNAGIRASRGKYVALLDADDVWEPNYLEVQVGILEADPTIAVVYPDAFLFGNPRDRDSSFMDLFPSTGEVTLERLLAKQCTVMISATIRRDALERAGLFDEALRSCEDFDLWLRILRAGGRIVYHRRKLVHYRRRPDSLSADPVWMCEHALRVLDKVESSMQLSPSERAAWLEHRRSLRAELKRNEAKSAFAAGDVRGALASLGEANAYLRSRKLALVLLLLRVAPRPLLWVYKLRHRLVVEDGANS